jgi:nicotinamidase-related amidase
MTSNNGAVVLLHMQNDVLDPAGAVGRLGNAVEVERRGVLQRTASLLDAARRAGLTVIHVGSGYQQGSQGLARNVPLFAHHEHDGERFIGTWPAEFHPEVAPSGADISLYHFGVVAFEGTPLGRILTVGGINRLYLAGVSTHLAVLATTFAAVDRGYYVTVVEDCCASSPSELHENALETLRLFAKIETSDSVIDGLGVPSGGPGV